jgi:type I restriction enzyme S subunit
MYFELDMPAGWNVYIFSDAIEVNPKRQLKKGEKAPFIEMKALNPNYRIVEKIDKILFKGCGSKFKNGDTLFARITPCLEHGKIAYIHKLETEQVGHGSTEFIVFSGIEGVIDDLFVYYLSRCDKIRNFTIKNMTGTSGRQRVLNDIFKQKRIKIPDITKQCRIVTILGALDDKIELNHQRNKTLDKMAQAIFESWFVDFDPFQNGEFEYNEELSKEIPKGWEVKPIDQIANFLNGLATQKYPPTDEHYLPVIKIRELRQGVTESSEKTSPDIENQYIVDDGEDLFSWSASLGVCIWCGGKGALNRHLFKVTSQTYPNGSITNGLNFICPNIGILLKAKQ